MCCSSLAIGVQDCFLADAGLGLSKRSLMKQKTLRHHWSCSPRHSRGHAAHGVFRVLSAASCRQLPQPSVTCTPRRSNLCRRHCLAWALVRYVGTERHKFNQEELCCDPLSVLRFRLSVTLVALIPSLPVVCGWRCVQATLALNLQYALHRQDETSLQLTRARTALYRRVLLCSFLRDAASRRRTSNRATKVKLVQRKRTNNAEQNAEIRRCGKFLEISDVVRRMYAFSHHHEDEDVYNTCADMSDLTVRHRPAAKKC